MNAGTPCGPRCPSAWDEIRDEGDTEQTAEGYINEAERATVVGGLRGPSVGGRAGARFWRPSEEVPFQVTRRRGSRPAPTRKGARAGGIKGRVWGQEGSAFQKQRITATGDVATMRTECGQGQLVGRLRDCEP